MRAKIIGTALACAIAAFCITGCSDNYKGEHFLIVYTNFSKSPNLDDISSTPDVQQSLRDGGQITLHNSVVTEIDPKYPTGYTAMLERGDSWSYNARAAMLSFVTQKGWKLQQVGDGNLMPYVFTKPIK